MAKHFNLEPSDVQTFNNIISFFLIEDEKITLHLTNYISYIHGDIGFLYIFDIKQFTKST